MTQDGPPTRLLHPVEPPFDPEYDGRPTNGRTVSDRTPPQDNAAEQAVLGAMLIATDAIDDVAALINPDDYYRPAHETIHHAIVELHQAGQPVDPVTVAAALSRKGELERIGGAPYLHTLSANVPIAANASHYASIVLEKAKLRAIVDAGTKLTQLGYAGHLDNAHTYLGDAVEHITDTAMRFGTTTGTTTTGLADMSWILTGAIPEATPPVYGRRTDGTALFYAGRVNGLFGDPECGKTWIALIAGIEAMHDDHTFAMVDVDHNGQDHTAARLLLLGARPEHLANPDTFRYYEPQDADELRAAVVDITALAPAVVVLDSLGEMLPMLGVKSIDNDEITAALRTIAMPPAKAGSCVIHIDHLPKSTEARSTGYAIGGTAKKRATDGAYLRVEARQQPVPGGVGRATLRIEKDRTGALRKSSGGGYAGTFTLNSTQEDITTWTIGRDEMPTNADGSFRPTGYMEKVAHFVASNEGCTSNDIEAGIAGTAKHIRSALLILIHEGHITRTPGPRRSWLHTLTIPYREAEDDNAQATL